MYLGLRFEDASEKDFFVIYLLALFLKSGKSEVKVKFFLFFVFSCKYSSDPSGIIGK